MTDQEWIDKEIKIADKDKLLRIIYENEYLFGYDPYYKDLRNAILDRLKELVYE